MLRLSNNEGNILKRVEKCLCVLVQLEILIIDEILREQLLYLTTHIRYKSLKDYPFNQVVANDVYIITNCSYTVFKNHVARVSFGIVGAQVLLETILNLSCNHAKCWIIVLSLSEICSSFRTLVCNEEDLLARSMNSGYYMSTKYFCKIIPIL